MIKYNFSSPLDAKLVNDAYNRLFKLIFGENNGNISNLYKDYFNENVKEVNVFKQGDVTGHLDEEIPGICRYDRDGKLIIEMLGTEGSNDSQREWLEHEATHEFCHSFADLVPSFFGKDESVIKGDLLLSNHAGMIMERNAATGELTGQNYYGKLYNETMMDIISTMAIKLDKGESISDVLISDVTQWRSAQTGYSVWTSITRLMIAAFSNNGFIDYDEIANQKYSIFDVNTKMRNGEVRKANDFMYGILFNPLHIEEEFDKFVGLGTYRTFSELLDTAFLTKQLSSELVKLIMEILPNFVNARCNYYLRSEMMSQNDVNAIISNFNKIWNSLQFEYQAYFSSSEIEEITSRGRNL